MPAIAFSHLMCGFLNRAVPLHTVTLGVVGGVIGGFIRGLVMVGLLISANEIVLPGLTAKRRDVERTPEMSVSGQEKAIGNFFFFNVMGLSERQKSGRIVDRFLNWENQNSARQKRQNSSPPS